MRRRSKTLTTVDTIMPLVVRFNELDDEDKLVFLDLIDPLPDEEEVKPTKRRKRRAGKSPRASSLAQQIKSAGLPKGDGEKAGEPKEPICAACGNVEDYADHSQPSPHYHPFVLPAQSARGRSSPNGESGASTVSSETETDTAGGVVHAASGGE